MQRGAQDGEQRGGEARGPAPEQPPGGGPQQRGGAEHERQGQDPGAGQAPDRVGERAERRVDDRGAGEVIRERGNGRAVQPVRPLQVPGPQVQRLVLERGIRPDQPQRPGRLNGQHHGQRPPARHPPPAHPPLLIRSGPPHPSPRRASLRRAGLRSASLRRAGLRSVSRGHAGSRRGSGRSGSPGLPRRRAQPPSCCRHAVLHGPPRLRKGPIRGIGLPPAARKLCTQRHITWRSVAHADTAYEKVLVTTPARRTFTEFAKPPPHPRKPAKSPPRFRGRETNVLASAASQVG